MSSFPVELHSAVIKQVGRYWVVLGKVLPRALVLLVLMLTVSGCLTTPVYTIPVAPEQSDCVTPAADEDVLIGLSVSGGGSRAALFAAGAFEAMSQERVGSDQRSLLEQISYISSVSGGSLASSYFVLRKPNRDTPVLSRDGDLTQEYREFFTDFKDAMARDYESALLARQIFSLRWFNPAWTARSLAEILEEEYLSDTTFDGLAIREAQGDSPRLLVNTTLYNDGSRLVLSTLPREASRYDFISDLNRHAPAQPQREDSERVLRQQWDTLLSTTPQDLDLDVCRIKVAGAVAASMSFPPVIGPVSFHIADQDEYRHVGDGGLSDNTGAESLLMVFLKKLREGKARRMLIIILDSSFPFDVGGEALNNRKEGFTLFSYDFSRIPSIMEERAASYRALFFRVAQRQGFFPGPRTFGFVRLRHTDAEWKEDLSDLPDSCREEGVDWKSPREVSRHLSGIVTRLWLESICDRDLVLKAAAKVVAQNVPKIRQFLEQ
ncbi:MAG: patatin-like phospholipase family protein [Nitrospiraceae bacterium]